MKISLREAEAQTLFFETEDTIVSVTVPRGIDIRIHKIDK